MASTGEDGHQRAGGRRAAGLALGLALSASLIGCADRRAAEAAPAPPPFEGVAIDLTPLPERRAIDVEVRVGGAAAVAVRRLSIARDWAGTRGEEAVRDLRVADALGPIATRPLGEAGSPEAELELERPAVGGVLSVRYRARGGEASASRLGLRVEADRAAGVGHGFLLLPRLDEPVPARIRWHAEGLGAGATGASSFGAGDEVIARATSSELAHAVYAAGRVGAAGGGGAPIIHVGAPRLDPTELARWTSEALGAAARLFDEPGAAAAAPIALVLVASPGLGRDHEGAFLERSLGLWFDPARPFDGALKIAVAHELLHRWIGSAVRVVDDEGRDAAWFSEGFTVHYARRVLLDARLITPEDLLADLQRTTAEPGGEARGSGPGAGRGAAASLYRHERGGEGYRRGALYAAALDHALRARNPKRPRSARAASLDDLMRELLGRAREGDGSVRVAAFRELVARELGDEAADRFDRLARGEARIVPPSAAFGPLFRRVDERIEIYDLGFDPASLTTSPSILHGVVPGSAAARAGAREGALVLAAKLPELDERGRPAGDAVITIADRRGGKKIRYRPASRRTVSRWELAPAPGEGEDRARERPRRAPPAAAPEIARTEQAPPR